MQFLTDLELAILKLMGIPDDVIEEATTYVLEHPESEEPGVSKGGGGPIHEMKVCDEAGDELFTLMFLPD